MVRCQQGKKGNKMATKMCTGVSELGAIHDEITRTINDDNDV